MATKNKKKKKKKNKQKFSKLQFAVLIRTVLPMLVMGVAIIVAGTMSAAASLQQEVYRSLGAAGSAVASSLDEMYPGDYQLIKGDGIAYLIKGRKELTGDFSFIDRIAKDSGMEVSLIYGDGRFVTTLKDENGDRYIGSGVHPNIVREMSEKQKTLNYRSEIGRGQIFYVAYVPLYNSDGSQVGMIGTAVSEAMVRSEVTAAARPIWIITILGMLVASFISIRYTNRIISAIRSMHKFLSRMVMGRLNNEMDESVLKRRDEIGATGESIVRMQNAVRVLVECDPLTTLYNRRSGDAKLKALLRKAAQTGAPFCVALGDIDFFKKVNDTYGHDAGDAVLKFVSAAMKDLVNGRGFAVRWGGEEFFLVFEEMGLIEVAAAIENFLEAIRASVVHHGGQSIRFTMSVGLVEGDPTRDAQEMTKEADEKLYYAKEHGRDQLVVTPGEEQPSYRDLLKQEQESDRNETLITFSDEFLDSENLMQLLSENALKEMEEQDGKDRKDGDENG